MSTTPKTFAGMPPDMPTDHPDYTRTLNDRLRRLSLLSGGTAAPAVSTGDGIGTLQGSYYTPD